MAFGHQHGLRCLIRSWISTRSLEVIEVTDVNSDPNCCKGTDPDMTLSSIPGPGDTMAQGDSAGHSGQHALDDSMAPGHPHDLRLWPRHWASLWPLVAICAMDINKDTGCGRTMDPDIVLESNQYRDATMAPGDSVSHSIQQGPLCGSLVVTSCDRTIDPDTVCGSSQDPDVTMAPGDSSGHSDWHGPQILTWLQVAVPTTGLCRAFSVDRSHRHHLILPHLLQALHQD